MVVSSAYTRVVADTDESYRRYPDDALMQVGVGKPDWTWTPYRLSWSGPVDTSAQYALGDPAALGGERPTVPGGWCVGHLRRCLCIRFLRSATAGLPSLAPRSARRFGVRLPYFWRP